MLTRREFLKIIGIATGSTIINLLNASGFSSNSTTNYFTLNPIIEQNPNAVFIMKTNIDVKTNSVAIKQAGLSFGQSVFQLTNDESIGAPLTNLFPIKPNVTSWQWDSPEDVDFEEVMGVITDAFFVEGIVESMKALGINSNQFSIRDANGSENIDHGGYGAMCNRQNIDVQLGVNDPQLQWVDVPDGTWFNRIPYLWPINSPDSWLLNISKFKAHSMGLTLCAKNLQGSVAKPYVRFCNDWGNAAGLDSENLQQNAFDTIADNYDLHRDAGIPRWDNEGKHIFGGLGMETWVSRCLDNNSVLRPGLNIIEGIYGRDGNGFYHGPNDGIGQDFMTNIIIFGKNAFYVDIIGHWLGGHEPGNFGLFHIAKEKGFIDTFNPKDIPLYEWVDGIDTLSSLENFDRFELRTPYMPKQDEEMYHLCNEPYEYGTSQISDNSIKKPESYILQQNYPNPFNATTSIKFILPESGNLRLEVFNIQGEIIDVLADGYYQQGTHTAVWNAQNQPSGTYFYRSVFKSITLVKKMMYIK